MWAHYKHTTHPIGSYSALIWCLNVFLDNQNKSPGYEERTYCFSLSCLQTQCEFVSASRWCKVCYTDFHTLNLTVTTVLHGPFDSYSKECREWTWVSLLPPVPSCWSGLRYFNEKEHVLQLLLFHLVFSLAGSSRICSSASFRKGTGGKDVILCERYLRLRSQRTFCKMYKITCLENCAVRARMGLNMSLWTLTTEPQANSEMGEWC